MKLYVAGPLFSAAERSWNEELAAALREAGHEVFLPQEQEPGRDAPGIFGTDVAGIDWADALVAIMDGPDPDSGTALGMRLRLRQEADHPRPNRYPGPDGQQRAVQRDAERIGHDPAEPAIRPDGPHPGRGP